MLGVERAAPQPEARSHSGKTRPPSAIGAEGTYTIYAWKAKYGGMDVSQAQEARQLREENARLKKLVADLSLDKDALQSVIRKNGWSSQP